MHLRRRHLYTIIFVEAVFIFVISVALLGQFLKPQPKADRPLAEEDKDKKEDMGAAMQKQMAIMMPLMIGYFAYTFSLGLSLYWNTFTVFAIIQQNYLNKKLALHPVNFELPDRRPRPNQSYLIHHLL